MFLIFRSIYSLLFCFTTVNCISINRIALKPSGFILIAPFTNTAPSSYKRYALDPDVPLEEQFDDSSILKQEEQPQISEDEFKVASVSAVQLASTGIDWLKILEDLKETNECAVNTNTLAYNTAITCATKNSDFDKAMDLFKEMKNENPDAIDVVTYKTLLLACELAGEYEHGVALYNDFLAAGLTADYGLLSSVLRCCSRQGYSEYAGNVFSDIKRITDPKLIDYQNIIRSCIECDNANGALNYFEEVSRTSSPKEMITPISDLIRYGAFTMNISVLSQMLDFVIEKKIDIGVKAFTEMLHGLYNCHDHDKMSVVWNKIYDLHKEDCGSLACKLMLKKCMVTGDCKEASDLLKDMETCYREALDEISYHSAISSCIPSGESKLAINFLRRAQLNNLSSLPILNAVYKACEKSDSWEDILNLYEQNIKMVSEIESRDVLESKIYYLLANYKMNNIDKVKQIIAELSKLQKYSFPFAIKIQKYIQDCVANSM